ncbi:ankyrin repeat domain-containing protein [Candidatus Cardinium hertigii]|uniref:Ankyrin repeat domain-containing protein n=1 Tax=Candidatus Cardinium hertigii TaxID=247481 RepID=A0A3N2QD16_9BACT|nr:ankyrin repeat domain-containing protein [Candidatus Cardinium hertigii]ROT47716.1 ankyrin repeat domain-containing protein [Candidatus Cardinium hertigii]
MIKKTKTIFLKSRKNNFVVQGITVLFISTIFIQARSCISSTPVMDYVVQHEDQNDFRKYIANKKDISQGSDGDRDWLYIAVKSHNPEKVTIILDRINRDKENRSSYAQKDFPNSIDPFSKKTPLGKAIQDNNKNIVNLLIKNQHINVNRLDNGLPTLLVAIQNKNEIIAQLLLDECPKDKLNITTKDPHTGSTPLHLAIEYGYKELTESLVNRLSLEDLIVEDAKQNTPLHVAAHYWRKEEFKLLFDQIGRLCPNNSHYIFDKLAKGYGISVFAHSYLSIHWIPGNKATNILKTRDSEMFKYILDTVGDYLLTAHFNTIIKEIDFAVHDGIIGEPYADVLRNIIWSRLMRKGRIEA